VFGVGIGNEGGGIPAVAKHIKGPFENIIIFYQEYLYLSIGLFVDIFLKLLYGVVLFSASLELLYITINNWFCQEFLWIK
jgi:hypothetical protein